MQICHTWLSAGWRCHVEPPHAAQASEVDVDSVRPEPPGRLTGGEIPQRIAHRRIGIRVVLGIVLRIVRAIVREIGRIVVRVGVRAKSGVIRRVGIARVKSGGGVRGDSRGDSRAETSFAETGAA